MADPTKNGEWPEYLEMKIEMPYIEASEQPTDPLLISQTEIKQGLTVPVKKKTVLMKEEPADVMQETGMAACDSAAVFHVPLNGESAGINENSFHVKEEILEDVVMDAEKMEVGHHCNIPSDKYVMLHDIPESQHPSSISPKRKPKCKLEEMRFTCDFCGYKCRQICHFKRHLRRHTGEKPYSCDHCDYSATDITTLRNHVRIHTGEKPYVCSLCDYKCAQIGNLITHEKMRHGYHEKRFACDVCDYKCRIVSHLKSHMKRHTGEKPYSCDHCDHSAADITALTNHLRVHTSEKPYACDFCDHKSAQISNLTAHERAHHGFNRRSLKYTREPSGGTVKPTVSNPDVGIRLQATSMSPCNVSLSNPTGSSTDEMSSLEISSVLPLNRLQEPSSPGNLTVDDSMNSQSDEQLKPHEPGSPSNSTLRNVSHCNTDEITKFQPSSISALSNSTNFNTDEIVRFRSCIVPRYTTLSNTSDFHSNEILSCKFSNHKCRHICHLKGHMGKHIGDEPYSCCVCDYRCTGEKMDACKFRDYKSAQRGNLKSHTANCHESSVVISSVLKRVKMLQEPSSPLTLDMCNPTDSSNDEVICLEPSGSLSITVNTTTCSTTGISRFKPSGSPSTKCNASNCSTDETTRLQPSYQISSTGNNTNCSSEEMRFSCDFCDYKCRQVCHFKRHLRRHTGEKPYSCNLCLYKCADTTTLKNHIRTHTGDKPYACNVCNYKSSQIGNLKSHMGIHMG